MIELFKDKPSNDNYILVEVIGDINNPMLYPPEKGWAVKDITNVECHVFNLNTNKMSTKNAYLDASGRLYLKTEKGDKLWLDEFVQR